MSAPTGFEQALAMKDIYYRPTDNVRSYIIISLVTALTAATCSSQNGEAPLTTAQCIQAGGSIVGDPGDGSVHRPDYICESGLPPLGAIRFLEGEPIPVEGAVCCPQHQ